MTFLTASRTFADALQAADKASNPFDKLLAAGLVDLIESLEAKLDGIERRVKDIESEVMSLPR